MRKKYSLDDKGSEYYTIRVRQAGFDEDRDEVIENCNEDLSGALIPNVFFMLSAKRHVLSVLNVMLLAQILKKIKSYLRTMMTPCFLALGSLHPQNTYLLNYAKVI